MNKSVQGTPDPKVAKDLEILESILNVWLKQLY